MNQDPYNTTSRGRTAKNPIEILLPRPQGGQHISHKAGHVTALRGQIECLGDIQFIPSAIQLLAKLVSE